MSKVSEGKAMLNLYSVSKKLTINGQQLSDYPHKGGGLLSGYIAHITLDPGEYVIVNDYELTSNFGKKNNKFKNVSLTVNLREGYDYDMGTYVDERELADAISYVELEHAGWYVACMINV
ncbi:MAG: hypothetical protein LBI64_03490 [Coriobacteriales bacterium]|jgi:hypothetical protein|nr:hypothetical protein [Coriobacteriales bacterium]